MVGVGWRQKPVTSWRSLSIQDRCIKCRVRLRVAGREVLRCVCSGYLSVDVIFLYLFFFIFFERDRA